MIIDLVADCVTSSGGRASQLDVRELSCECDTESRVGTDALCCSFRCES